MLGNDKKYLNHIVIGLGLIAIGIWLIVNDRFFIWPPQLLDFVNDDIWGYTYILTGCGLIIWVNDTNRSIKIKWNKIL